MAKLDRFIIALDPGVRARLEKLGKELPGEPSAQDLARTAIGDFLKRWEAATDLSRELVNAGKRKQKGGRVQ